MRAPATPHTRQPQGEDTPPTDTQPWAPGALRTQHAGRGASPPPCRPVSAGPSCPPGHSVEAPCTSPGARSEGNGRALQPEARGALGRDRPHAGRTPGEDVAPRVGAGPPPTSIGPQGIWEKPAREESGVPPNMGSPPTAPVTREKVGLNSPERHTADTLRAYEHLPWVSRGNR